MKAYAYLIRLTKSWLLAAIFSGIISLSLLPLGAQASTYGSGSYGSCAYSTGCASSSGTGAVATPSTSPTPSAVLLNDFTDYFSAAGKDVTATQGQVISFNITVNGVLQHYSATIQQIGADFAVVLISGTTPSTVRFSIGQTQSFDVTGDGVNDIQITLNSITGGQAQFNFRDLTRQTQPTTSTPATTTPSSSGRSYWLWVGLFGLCLLVGIGIFLWLWLRRRRKPQPITNQPQ